MTERSMVDANVLIFAFKKINSKDKEDVRGWREASLELLKRMKVIRVCAVAWMEFVRGIRAEERDELASIYQRIQPEAVDGRIVERAVALLHARKLSEKRCFKCQNALDARPCPACKRLVSSKQNLNDAIIVASAELTDDVDVLYCYDNGINEFVTYIDSDRCTITEPPNPIGPLFDRRT